MLKDAYNTRRREVPIHYHSDRINKQMSSLPDILIKLRMEINAESCVRLQIGWIYDSQEKSQTKS
jgi:hypothetical protein